jgi:hypothetical protein
VTGEEDSFRQGEIRKVTTAFNFRWIKWNPIKCKRGTSIKLKS